MSSTGFVHAYFSRIAIPSLTKGFRTVAQRAGKVLPGLGKYMDCIGNAHAAIKSDNHLSCALSGYGPGLAGVQIHCSLEGWSRHGQNILSLRMEAPTRKSDYGAHDQTAK